MKKTLFRIFKGILIFLLIVLAIAGGILAYNMWLNQTFVTTFYTVTTDKDIENMRIVELSDRICVNTERKTRISSSASAISSRISSRLQAI